VLAFQDGELLAKKKVLEQQAVVGAKNAKNGSEPEPQEVEHGGKVIADQILIC
jgi:hypothetical protein